MLLRSLATELYKDETGRRALPKPDNALDSMLGIQDADQASGYIYILQSLSANPDISAISNLYKIGYATSSVEKRIANAANESTYLMASVPHVSSYKCFNMNAQKFENLLHTFFGKACLDIKVADSHGKMCSFCDGNSDTVRPVEVTAQSCHSWGQITSKAVRSLYLQENNARAQNDFKRFGCHQIS